MPFFPATAQKKQIAQLKEELEARTGEVDHLQKLVEKMESTPNQDEMMKVQIADLKSELAHAEGSE